MAKFQEGQPFLTERGEANIRYELASALDGQGKAEAALQAYQELLSSMRTGSYYEMSARYEIPRMNLKLWLRSPTPENRKYLDNAAEGWDSWLARDWQGRAIKLWGYYHAACAQKELLAIERLAARSIDAYQTSYDEYASQFLELARKQKGVKRYELRFSAFFLESPDFNEFPGEPLKCGLGGLLKEFQIR